MGAGLSTREIADKQGRSQSNIMYWLTKHGLNAAKPRRIAAFKCANCASDVARPIYRDMLKYCSAKCQHEHARSLRFSEWMNGDAAKEWTPGLLRKLVADRDGRSCSKCGISTWNDMPLSLELEHKDGNGLNNRQENLCLMCPNCHSQTPTFRARNKGFGRKARRMIAERIT